MLIKFLLHMQQEYKKEGQLQLSNKSCICFSIWSIEILKNFKRCIFHMVTDKGQLFQGDVFVINIDKSLYAEYPTFVFG